MGTACVTRHASSDYSLRRCDRAAARHFGTGTSPVAPGSYAALQPRCTGPAGRVSDTQVQIDWPEGPLPGCSRVLSPRNAARARRTRHSCRAHMPCSGASAAQSRCLTGLLSDRSGGHAGAHIHQGAGARAGRETSLDGPAQQRGVFPLASPRLQGHAPGPRLHAVTGSRSRPRTLVDTWRSARSRRTPLVGPSSPATVWF